MMCFLIKNGYGNYQSIIQIPLHLFVRHYKWFIENQKVELKAKRDYDMAMAKIGCPLFRHK